MDSRIRPSRYNVHDSQLSLLFRGERMTKTPRLDSKHSTDNRIDKAEVVISLF